MHFCGGFLALPSGCSSTFHEEAETSSRPTALKPQQSSLLHLCYSEMENKNIDSCLLSCMQPLTIFQRSLTTMQIQIQGLLQFAVPLFPTAEVSHTLGHSRARLSKAPVMTLHLLLLLILFLAEGPAGYPAPAQLLGGQFAPADCPAGL